jgi:hypothetical protein
MTPPPPGPSLAVATSLPPGWTEYEARVVEEIARHIVSPSLLRRALETAGRPIEKILEIGALSKIRPVQWTSELVFRGVRRALETSLTAASWTAREDGVLDTASGMGIRSDSVAKLRDRPLEELDALADRFERSHALLLGAEGAALGAATTLSETIPFAFLALPTLVAADVSASMTLLARHASRIATSYGYAPSVPENRVHIIAAMAPQGDSPDEGYFAAKAAAVETMVEAGHFLARRAGKNMTRRLLEGEAPKIVRLLHYVANRIGVVLTEKELGMLVPVAGAALNAGLNVAFQKIGHTAVKDYFRLMILEERYGEAAVRGHLDAMIAARRAKPA